MMTILLALSLLQDSPCASLPAAVERIRAMDLAGAVERLRRAADAECANQRTPTIYLGGLLAAREAYRVGGSRESLAPVVAAVEQLKSIAAAGKGDAFGAEIAVYVLQAAAAAAQSERDTLKFFIDLALELEQKRWLVDLPGAPLISAHEVAGDLWLQVHRYEDARRAYLSANGGRGGGRSVAATLGLARSAHRLMDVPGACAQYAAAVAAWKVAGPEPPGILEARAYLKKPACAQLSPKRP